MKKSVLGPNIKTLLLPVVYITVATFLFVVISRLGVSEITKQRKSLSDIETTNIILSQKQTLLRAFESNVSDYVSSTANALPEKNSALSMVSQIKNLAALNGTLVSAVKIGAETAQAGTSSVEITFGIDGLMSDLLNFLNSLASVAPISSIQKAKVNSSAGIASADITIRAYSAPYPQRLPSLTEPITDLSNDEKTLLDTLSNLTLPLFTTLEPQQPAVRDSPFE